jgi:hypothetical protein
MNSLMYASRSAGLSQLRQHAARPLNRAAADATSGAAIKPVLVLPQ